MKNIEDKGSFKYQNVIPEYMPGWWVYHYCPAALYKDQHRFWKMELLAYELEKFGFSTTQSISITKKDRSTQQILKDFERRDVSQLAMIEDSNYQSGLNRIKKDVERRITHYKNEFALGTIVAKL